MKTLSAFALLVAGLAIGMAPAIAQNASSSQPAPKKAQAKKAAKSEAKAEDDDEPDVKGLQATAFNCELGNKLTIYTDAANDQQIALHWNKRTHRMQRVTTTTGAQRFENAKNGLVWIGIPAKGMLLDSKHGKQLANECKNPEQAGQKVAER
ncbi:MAG TPA: hypothetical protein VEC01_16200 [Noviherbaspirillum sp.]|uniref:hypothetical protein n=1 Tax=Noviherbaspirillum sp. TaxID=1926288 RepID=UPI002D6FAAD1|nr:hypothetical protein [Noviherbaspirillum sp.]HYD96872.1 hypothetical protein [Noviherbaspirillum sp.]